MWFEEILTCRQWKTQEGKAGDSMYDLQWDDDGAEKQFPFQPKKRLEEKLPSMLDVEEVLLKQLLGHAKEAAEQQHRRGARQDSALQASLINLQTLEAGISRFPETSNKTSFLQRSRSAITISKICHFFHITRAKTHES